MKPHLRMSWGTWLCSLGMAWGRGPTPLHAWNDYKRQQAQLNAYCE